MRVCLKTLLYFLLAGLGLGAVAIRAQVTNPTFAVLNLEHYRAYYSFYMLGEALDNFARLGALVTFLVATSFALGLSKELRLTEYLSFSRRGESFSWPWRTHALCSLFVLGLFWQIGSFVAIGSDLISHEFGNFHRLAFSVLVLGPLLALAALERSTDEHRVLKYPLIFLAFSGGLLAYLGWDVAEQLVESHFVIPPLMSTHFGPWGILGWILALALALGLATSGVFLGLKPRSDAEPASLDPLNRKNIVRSVLLLTTLSLTLLASYPVYFVPRFQVGQDLRDVLACHSEEVPGRTVVFLDHHDEPHTIEPFRSWSNRENLSKLRDWIGSAPTPSALTRPAAKILADHALWEWAPTHALDWLEVQRRRQKYSNLNRAFLAAVEQTKPSPGQAKHLDNLLNRDRFAWPGAGSRLELAAQLERYGRSSEAAEWRKSAESLGGNNLTVEAAPTGSGVIHGRLLLDGNPLAGTPVALFRDTDESKLLERTRAHIEGERELLEQSWRPVHYQYLDFERLTNFYAMTRTDENGGFHFAELEDGKFRIAVRLQSPASLAEGDGGLVMLSNSEEKNLGELHLNRI